MAKRYIAIHFGAVTDFLKKLPADDKVKILGSASKMEQGDFQSPYIKTLRGPIKELIVKEYRLVFFIIGHFLYFICAFRKKSMKTPKKEIEYAESVYKMFTN